MDIDAHFEQREREVEHLTALLRPMRYFSDNKEAFLQLFLNQAKGYSSRLGIPTIYLSNVDEKARGFGDCTSVAWFFFSGKSAVWSFGSSGLCKSYQ